MHSLNDSVTVRNRVMDLPEQANNDPGQGSKRALHHGISSWEPAPRA